MWFTFTPTIWQLLLSGVYRRGVGAQRHVRRRHSIQTRRDDKTASERVMTRSARECIAGVAHGYVLAETETWNRVNVFNDKQLINILQLPTAGTRSWRCQYARVDSSVLKIDDNEQGERKWNNVMQLYTDCERTRVAATDRWSGTSSRVDVYEAAGFRPAGFRPVGFGPAGFGPAEYSRREADGATRGGRVRPSPCPDKRYGDVLMLSSTWTHSHFPKHSTEPYSSLAHPTAATSCIPTKLPTVITINHSINKVNNI